MPSGRMAKASAAFLRYSSSRCSRCPLPNNRYFPRFVGRPFFCHSFSWSLLRANSCVRRLRVFCFLGSALWFFWVPPRMQPLALEAEALAFLCPRKMGQKMENQTLCPT